MKEKNGGVNKIMPYIHKDARMKFQEGIDSILEALYQNNDGDVKVGEINYVFSSIIWELFKDDYSYTNGNNLIGVLECVKQEFIRRQLNVYEDQKIKENGDL